MTNTEHPKDANMLFYQRRDTPLQLSRHQSEGSIEGAVILPSGINRRTREMVAQWMIASWEHMKKVLPEKWTNTGVHRMVKCAA